MKSVFKVIISFLVILLAVQQVSGLGKNAAQKESLSAGVTIHPKLVTEKLPHDTDDPAIWINPNDIKKSLILGTDKNRDGGLYVFDLNGNILKDKIVSPLKRPNNVDVEYGLLLKEEPVDIAVVTERLTHKLRVFRLPDMAPVDNGGIEVFEGQTGINERDLMGISLYRRQKDGAVFAIVGRKTGPSGSYLWQYLLHDDGSGKVEATLVRKFGLFSGKKEIEAIAVDDALGYIYYSDEGVGVRKFYADPSMGDKQLALFGTEGFKEDHEGISIYSETPETGYILVSDQSANEFHIFPRQGTSSDPHSHPLLKVVKLATLDSDGSEVTSIPLGKLFPKGLFVAMSTDRTFHYYSWEDIMP
jgi:3-phytase